MFAAIRPAEVHWFEAGQVGSETIIDNLFGDELTEAMRSVRLVESVGYCSLELNLNRRNRRKLAEMQLCSPSTPTLLKRASGGMLGEMLKEEEVA